MPDQPAAPRHPFYLRGWFWLLVAFLLLWVLYTFCWGMAHSLALCSSHPKGMLCASPRSRHVGYWPWEWSW